MLCVPSVAGFAPVRIVDLATAHTGAFAWAFLNTSPDSASFVRFRALHDLSAYIGIYLAELSSLTIHKILGFPDGLANAPAQESENKAAQKKLLIKDCCIAISLNF